MIHFGSKKKPNLSSLLINNAENNLLSIFQQTDLIPFAEFDHFLIC